MAFDGPAGFFGVAWKQSQSPPTGSPPRSTSRSRIPEGRAVTTDFGPTVVELHAGIEPRLGNGRCFVWRSFVRRSSDAAREEGRVGDSLLAAFTHTLSLAGTLPELIPETAALAASASR